MPVTLYKFGHQWGLPDASPFCVKLESFLKLHDIDHEMAKFDVRTTLGNAPKKKLPYVQLENGENIGDSALIIKRLANDLNIDLQGGLDDKQRAISHALCCMLDGSLYFCLVYSRWIDDTGWDVVQPLFFGSIPKIMRGCISKKVRGDVRKQLWNQGYGRHSKAEIYAIARDDLDALSALLGEDEWFFGAPAPTLLDICVHSYIINIIHPPIDNDMKAHGLRLSNLCAHAERFHKHVYGCNIMKKST